MPDNAPINDPEPGINDEQVVLARGYRVGTWGKTQKWPNYKCIYCQYATLWIAKMEKHQALGEHPWAFPGQNQRTVGAVGDGPEY